MREITLEELLSAGCHFGHQVNRRNPKADEFIFEARTNIHIIDLEKTRDGLIKASEYLKDLSSKGGNLIIVGTKRQAKGIVDEAIKKAKEGGVKNLFFVTSRWIGGLLTNNLEVSKNFKKLKEINDLLQSGSDKGYTKREMVLFEKERNKLENLYGGVKDLTGMPQAMYIIDTHNELTAVREARAIGITTVGIVDTNSDPTVIDYSIPANDDAVGSIGIITNYLIDAWIEGQKEIKDQSSNIKTEKKEEAEEKEKKVKGEKKKTKTSKGVKKSEAKNSKVKN